MDHGIHIGLTFYGGVSLAVFEAGVAYELVRAVQYSRIKDELEDFHIDVISGTSAGGLTAVQLAAALSGRDADGVLAKMMSMWANKADVSRLIPDRGFSGQGILDNKVLKNGIAALLKIAVNGEKTPLETDLDFLLTVTNFSGLREPVFLPHEQDGAQAFEVFPSTRHCEYEKFSARDLYDEERRSRIVEASASTAGFPFAFPPTIMRSESLPDEVRTPFVYLDGGLKDNWPLGVALEAIGQRPSPCRKYYFIDPKETYREPTYDPLKNKLTDDPFSVLGNLLHVARADSIYQDLEDIRRTNDRLKILERLSKEVLENAELRSVLLDLHGLVTASLFNQGAQALWLMVKDIEPVGALKGIWNEIRNEPRYYLRNRVKEYLNLLKNADKIHEDEAGILEAFLDRPDIWKAYYEAVQAIQRQNRYFLNLRYKVWREAYRSSDGRRKPENLSDELFKQIEEQLVLLLENTKTLKDERTRLENQFFEKSGIEKDGLDLFYEYAKAMQVLESLAGLKFKGQMSVSRITPFDFYSSNSQPRNQRPLAGGTLGAFGGFLSKSWRLNDFTVGRLVMRNRLQTDKLIPKKYFDDYLEAVDQWDRNILAKLSAGSEERQIAAKLIELAPDDQGPYDDDEHKPEGLLLRDADMELDSIPPSRMSFLLRGISGSFRGLFKRNADRFPYSLLRPLNKFIWLAERAVWLFEKTLLKRPETKLGGYIRALLIGILLGFILGWLLRW